MPNVPARRRRLVVAALVGVALVCASSAVRPIDPLPTDPPKPSVKAEVLPDLPSAPGNPQLPALPGGGPEVPGALPLPPLPGGPVNPPLPSVPVAPAAPVMVPKYVNKPDVEFDFEVSKKGRAGVKAVSLWMRAEASVGERIEEWRDAQTQPVKADGESKLGVKLPADGRYEFRLQLTGENGRKSVEFALKTQPEMVIVLDTKPPVVKDVKLEPPANGEKQAVIRWTATDANLGEKCVTLEYEQKAGGAWAKIADGVWAKIADGLPNSGSYTWQLDDKLPVSTRVRVTVTDLAGNSTAVMSDAPTNLDSVVPEGRLTGVRAVEPQPVQDLDPDWTSPRLVAPPPRLARPSGLAPAK